MKKYTLREIVTEYVDKDLPPDVKAYLEADPDRWSAYEQARRTYQLITLKRHERPDDASVGRCCYHVTKRIENMETISDPWHERLWEMISGPTPAPVRYGLATLLVMLVAVNVFTHTQDPNSTPLVAENILSAAAPAVLSAATNVGLELGSTPKEQPTLAAQGDAVEEPILVIASNSQFRSVRPSPNVGFVGNDGR